MSIKVEKIFLSSDWDNERRKRSKNEKVDKTDVIVKMKDGCYYVASFFTFQSLATKRNKLVKKDQNDFIKSTYFWIKEKTILIDICSRVNIEKVITDLIEDGNFKLAFENISQDQSTNN